MKGVPKRMEQLTLTQFGIFEHVECDKLLGINALQTQNLNACAREATLRRFGSAFHKENHGR